jgi:hypothetical protein
LLRLLCCVSSVAIVTAYKLVVSGLIPGSARFFSSLQRPDRLWGPTSRLSKGYWGDFPGKKRQRREADLSPQSSSEVNNDGAIPQPPIYLHGIAPNYAQGQLYLLRLLWSTTHVPNTVSLSSPLRKIWIDNHSELRR